MCDMRTDSGIYGFGSSNCAFISTAKRSPTANPASHHRPLIMRITGSAKATHNNDLKTSKGANNGLANRVFRHCAKNPSSSVLPE